MLNRLMLWGNRIAAVLLLATFAVPYLAPSDFPRLSLASLAVSPLLLINALFMLFWLFRRWKKMFLSAILLLLAYLNFGPFIEFSSEGDPTEYRETISVLSYNVRLFNAYEKDVDTVEVAETISELIKTQDPDIICVQEYFGDHLEKFTNYPYRFVHFRKNHKMGHAIFSKYPLANTGAFNFKDSHNNSIYADVVKGGDTIRVYNLHLQSIGILPNVEYLQDESSERLRTRMSAAFVKQESQVNDVLKHKSTSPYPVILTGDVNNTPFSYIYRQLSSDLKDAFKKRGNGIGTTFKFDFYPIRIDYIFCGKQFDVVQFETVNSSFSDHLPVTATLGWPVKASD